MNKKIKQKWLELNNLVFDLNYSGFHVFVSYSGHTDTFSVSYYDGGFSENKPPQILDHTAPMTVENIDKHINWLCKNYK